MSGKCQSLVDMEPPDPCEALVHLREIESTHGMEESFPFLKGDATAGVENELQAVVVGGREDVDLPITIQRSNYYANTIRRSAVGDISPKGVSRLERYLNDNTEGVWENSWVRFPKKTLDQSAREILNTDLLADKTNPGRGQRSDADRFSFVKDEEEWVRVPISYLLKLSLADFLGVERGIPLIARHTGQRLLGHFSNDNTSPETHSFHVIPLTPATGMGRAVARETAKRFLLSQLLLMYANAKFLLRANGQQAMVYFAPHPPVRQRELSEGVSDTFYRELFMSPCLSGWNEGEVKQEYMHLCHQVLSRSQLNAVAKMREAGIITSNLVMLPSTSNTSLANNGTHVSLGSRLLSRALGDTTSGFTAAHEKTVGDLAIKIVEHFLPLFVGTYTAAPYRFDFADFHPERILGFLPHELDFTHLRMLWRRWRKKAKLKLFGQPITPFGPRWFDRLIASCFGLRGDLVPDWRLIDYLVALLSTAESPGLDGRLGNSQRLKKDLADLGVFDARMATYLPYRLREFGAIGFSGFEGRQYSVFESFKHDLAKAVELQLLVTALAFKYIAQEGVNHAHIPDSPPAESERRQFLFGAAIGLPTLFVREDSGNQFLRRILGRTRKVRPSHKYPGYLRIRTQEFRRALLGILREDASDLAESLGLDIEPMLADLSLRLDFAEEWSVAGRLIRGILEKAEETSALDLDGRRFNLCAEAYYREDLRRRHMAEALHLLAEDFEALDRLGPNTSHAAGVLRLVVGDRGAGAFLAGIQQAVLDERVAIEDLRALMSVILISVYHDSAEAEARPNEPNERVEHPASVRRSA